MALFQVLTLPFIICGTLLSLVAVIFLVYLLVLVRPRGEEPKDKSLLCDYAHRGLHGNGVPENSLAAFRNSVKYGFGIELDVQLCINPRISAQKALPYP